MQFIEFSGAIVLSFIVPPESVTIFANSFSNHSLRKAQPKFVLTADVFSIKSSEIVFEIPGERTGFQISWRDS